MSIPGSPVLPMAVAGRLPGPAGAPLAEEMRSSSLRNLPLTALSWVVRLVLIPVLRLASDAVSMLARLPIDPSSGAERMCWGMDDVLSGAPPP